MMKIWIGLVKVLVMTGYAENMFETYSQQQKERENLLRLNLLKIKYVEFKKYI